MTGAARNEAGLREAGVMVFLLPISASLPILSVTAVAVTLFQTQELRRVQKDERKRILGANPSLGVTRSVSVSLQESKLCNDIFQSLASTVGSGYATLGR